MGLVWNFMSTSKMATVLLSPAQTLVYVLLNLLSHIGAWRHTTLDEMFTVKQYLRGYVLAARSMIAGTSFPKPGTTCSSA